MNMFRKIFQCLLFATVFLTMAVPVHAASDELTDKDNQVIEDIIRSNLKKSEIPGLAVVIVKGNEIVYNKGFGYADKSAGTPMTTDTLFELGSVSKAFTAMAVLKLRDQGLIGLDDPIAKYLPWLKFTYKGKETDVTLRQFLHHNSGIAANMLGKIPRTQGPEALEKTVRTLIGKELVEKPGERFIYSTINYDVLGLVIQQVSGMPYAEFMKREIVQPLDLNHTYIGRENAPPGQLSKGYKWAFTNPSEYDAPYFGGNVPAAYVLSSSTDMGNWLKVQLGTAEADKHLMKLAVETQQDNRAVPPFNDGSFYAMGWNVLQLGGGQLFHDGNNPNFFTSLILRPQEGLGIAVLSNLETYNPQKISRELMNYLIGRDQAVPYYDNYARLDKTGTVLLIASGLFMAYILYSFVSLALKIFRKKRRFARIKPKAIMGLIASVPVMALTYYCLDQIPQLLFQENWATIYIYTPGTLYLGVLGIGIAIAAFILYFMMDMLFPKQAEISYLTLSVLSLLSGFGNALIVYAVNAAASRQSGAGFNRLTPDQAANLRLLLLYFGFGILLYVVGQRILRPILIRWSNEIIFRKRTELLSKILRISYQDLEKIKRENIQATLNNDTEAISNIVNLVVSGLTSAITLLFCFVYLGMINVIGLLITVGVIGCAAALYYIVGKRANTLWEQTRDIQNVFFKYINDLAQGFKELALNRRKRNDFREDFNESCNEYRDKRTKGDISFAMVFIVGELLFVMVLGVIAFLFPVMFDNAFSFVRDYVFVFIYMVGPINVILVSIPQLTQIRVSWKRIEELNRTLDEVVLSDERQTNVLSDARIELAAEEVEYEYENVNGDKFSVGPISATFRSGEIVFITGGNGSGKSTFAKLLTGLYRPSKGRMLVNGDEIGLNELSEHYTAIFSDFHLFNRLYGVDYASRTEEIERHLQLLHLDDKVRIEGGGISAIELSTGQKKRLALLISYLDNRPIYLFDEWAADQDPEYRKFFYHNLLPELKERGKCIIAVTHDDMYFHLADRFIKLDLGRIVEDGGSREAAMSLA